MRSIGRGAEKNYSQAIFVLRAAAAVRMHSHKQTYLPIYLIWYISVTGAHTYVNVSMYTKLRGYGK